MFEYIRLRLINVINILDMWPECVPFELIEHIADVNRSAVSDICLKLRSLYLFNLYSRQ
jgi:hypothetical protein